MMIYRSHLIRSEIWGGVSQVCHGLYEPQATNVLVIKLYFIRSRVGASIPETRQNTHHRQYNTALLLIITFVTPHHLAHVSATVMSPETLLLHRKPDLRPTASSAVNSIAMKFFFRLENLLRGTGMKLSRPRNAGCQMWRCETAT